MRARILHNWRRLLARRKARAEARRRKAAAAKEKRLKKKNKKKKATTPKPRARRPTSSSRVEGKLVTEEPRSENTIPKTNRLDLNPAANNLPENVPVKVESTPSQQNNVLIPWAMVEGPLDGERSDKRREPAALQYRDSDPTTKLVERTSKPSTPIPVSPTTKSTSTITTSTTTTTSTAPTTPTTSTTTTTPTTTTTTTTPTTTTTTTTTTTPTTTTTTTTIPTTTTTSTTTTTPTTIITSSTATVSTTPVSSSNTPATVTTTGFFTTPSLMTSASQSTAESASDSSTAPASEANSTVITEIGENAIVDLTKTKASGEIILKDKEGLMSENALLLQADSPSNPDLEVKLTGGRYPWEGLLEVRTKGPEPGPWGSVCGDQWGMKETMVVCRQLGLNHAKQPLKTNYFGGQDQVKMYYAFKCTGREAKLSDCPAVKASDTMTCPKKTAVAGVVCATFLPDLIPNLQTLKDSVRLQDRPLYYLQCALEENCLSSSAYEIRNNTKNWRQNNRRLLRFSTIVHNRGDADFRPAVAKGQWEWHACHMHYHSMEVFAHYDIMDQNGTRLAEGSKASFCLEDTTCDRGVARKFQCVGFGDQGLSVNCSDNYLWDIDCQWIDITDIKPGIYTFLMEINPSFLVAELDFDNNVARCDLWYSGYFAQFTNCRHKSLLDYRR